MQNRGNTVEKEPHIGNLLDNPKYKKKQGVDYSAYQGSVENAANASTIVRFNGQQGHGFAAERANQLIDQLQGKEAVILGDDNAKNGPDRMVDGILIQTKYCRTAADSVNAAFHGGKYRYIDVNGNAMQIEVPKDQYEEALVYMKRRIAKGQVPGVKDVNDAEKLVRKGNVDYKTACRIAKAGNIDSLIYDAANGSVVAVGAFGISGAITFAKAVWDGESVDKAIDSAVCAGLQSGGLVFVSSVLAAQLTRTSINEALLSPSIGLVKLLPSSVRHSLVNSLRNGSVIYGNAATNNLAKLIRNNAIAAGAMIVVMSAGDISNYFRGRMSAKQLLKNVTTLAAGVGGGYIGGAVGGSIGSVLGPAGTYAGAAIGGLIGGTISGQGANKVLSNFVEDDVNEMLEILNHELIPLVEEYLISEDELDIIIEELRQSLVQDKLLEMYASSDRNAFARDLLTEQITAVIKWRVRISIPSDKDLIPRMGYMIELSNKEGALQSYFASGKVDGQQIAKQLLGKEVSKHAGKKAWYITRQMNTISMQQEEALRTLAKDEAEFREKKAKDNEELDKLKNEFESLLRSDENA